MAVSKKITKIGVMAEEKNDVDVLYEYTAKLVATKRFSFVSFVGHGCGKLRHKCRAWAQNLLDRGCARIVLVHDCDKTNESKLRRELDKQIRPVSGKFSVVLIPIEELEAWLLSDPEAIKDVFNMRKSPRIPASPESIKDPKEFLGRLVAKGSKSHYLNTVHNRKIAARQQLATLDRCPSFSRYPKFLEDPGL